MCSSKIGAAGAVLPKPVQNSSGGEHPGVLYFYSESLGLGANAICALLAATSNFSHAAGNVDGEPSSVAIGVCFIAVGGLIQLLAALVIFRAYNHFGGTTFAFFSVFWALLGLEQLIGPHASMIWLHAALIATNVLLTAIAPIVNGFYTVALGTIALASALEFAGRTLTSSGLAVATGISEIFIVLVTSYGVAAAVLHGIYERQVLPGFDDALIEKVLWKRKPLTSDYSDGTWANPNPLGSICASMVTLALGLWLYNPSDSIVPTAGLTCWLATFALVLWLVSLLHCLRSEASLSINSLYRGCLGAVISFGVIFFEAGQEPTSTMLPITVVFTFAQAIILSFFLSSCLKWHRPSV